MNAITGAWLLISHFINSVAYRLDNITLQHIPEQYFYPDYFNYQPDYAEKYYTLGRILKEYGYRFITVDEMK